MDETNIRNMLKIFGGDPDKKVHKLLEFTAENRDVSDPWYSRRFDIAYNDIFNGCTALINNI